MKNELFLSKLCRIAKKAGDAIMPYYGQPVDVERKADKSPVTKADLAAHDVIVAELEQLTPDIPIISEEHPDHVLPKHTRQFWLVDPLDGTKSFIRGTGEFTVNIGLIEQGAPVLGVIYIPAEGVMYWGAQGLGAWKQQDGGMAAPIRTRPAPAEGLAAVVSLSHLDPQTEQYLGPLNICSRISAASSLKFCRVAEGEADIYPRFGPTMEWDTAAGHAITVAAGGRVLQPDGAAFCYGKEGLKNGPFIVFGR